jgi:hypothetical protein
MLLHYHRFNLAMAQIAFFDLASTMWHIDAAALGKTKPAGCNKRQRTAEDEELVAAYRQHSKVALQKAQHNMVLAAVMSMLEDQVVFRVEDREDALLLAMSPIVPTFVSAGAEFLQPFAKCTSFLELWKVDISGINVEVINIVTAELPNLAELRLHECQSMYVTAIIGPWFRQLRAIRMVNCTGVGASDVLNMCDALTHRAGITQFMFDSAYSSHDSLEAGIAATAALSSLVSRSPALRYLLPYTPGNVDLAPIVTAVGMHSQLRHFHVNPSDAVLDTRQLRQALAGHSKLRWITLSGDSMDALCGIIADHPRLSGVNTRAPWSHDDIIKLCEAVRPLKRMTTLLMGALVAGEFPLRVVDQIRNAIVGKPLREFVCLQINSIDSFLALAFDRRGVSTFGPMVDTLRSIAMLLPPEAVSMLSRMLPNTAVALA